MNESADPVKAKENLREICYGQKYEELTNLLVKMKDKESNNDSNRIFDLYCNLSKDLFSIEAILV